MQLNTWRNLVIQENRPISCWAALRLKAGSVELSTFQMRAAPLPYQLPYLTKIFSPAKQLLLPLFIDLSHASLRIFLPIQWMPHLWSMAINWSTFCSNRMPYLWKRRQEDFQSTHGVILIYSLENRSQRTKTCEQKKFNMCDWGFKVSITHKRFTTLDVESRLLRKD